MMMMMMMTMTKNDNHHHHNDNNNYNRNNEYGVGWSSAYQEEVNDPAHKSLWLLVPAAPQLPLSGLRYGAGGIL